MDPIFQNQEAEINKQNVQIDTTKNKEADLFKTQQNAPQQIIANNSIGEINLGPLTAETMKEKVDTAQIMQEKTFEPVTAEMKVQQTVKQTHTGETPSAQAGLMMKKIVSGEETSLEENQEAARFETVVNKEKKKISHQVLADQAIEAQIEKDKQAMQNLAENQEKMTPEEKEQKLRTFAFPELLYTAIVEIEKTINMRGQRQDYREIASDVRTLRGLLDQHKNPSMLGDTSQREIGNLLFKIRSSVLQYKKKHWAVASFTAEGKRLALMTRILNVCDQAMLSEDTDARTRLIALKQIAVDDSDAGIKNKDTVKLFQQGAENFNKKHKVRGPANHYVFQTKLIFATSEYAHFFGDTKVQTEYALKNIPARQVTGSYNMDSRCDWLFKPVYLNENGELQSDLDKENEAYNKEMVENIVSLDVQKRTKLVMEVLKRLFAIKITPEMFSLKYMQSHIPEMLMLQQLEANFENIITADVVNKAILNSLPEEILKKKDALLAFSTKYTMAIRSMLALTGASIVVGNAKCATAKITESPVLKRLQKGEALTVKLTSGGEDESQEDGDESASNAEAVQKRMIETAETEMEDGSIEINENAYQSSLIAAAYLYSKEITNEGSKKALENNKMDVDQLSLSMITQTELDELENMLSKNPTYKGKEKDTSQVDRDAEIGLRSISLLEKEKALGDTWKERLKIMRENYERTNKMIKTIQRLRTFNYSTLSSEELGKVATLLGENTSEALGRKEALMDKLAKKLLGDMTQICNGTYNKREYQEDVTDKRLTIKLY